MLHEDVKAYLIVLTAERCPQEEYLFQSKVLNEFVSLVGNIPFDELRLSHLLAFDALKGKIAAANGSEWENEFIQDPLSGVHSFLLWRSAQSDEPAKRMQKIPCFFF